MTRYAVWSSPGWAPRDDKAPPTEKPVDTLEVTRTERRVAEEDAALIRDVFKRKSWVQEQGLTK